MEKDFYRIAVEHPKGKARELHISKRFLSLFLLSIVTITSAVLAFLFLSGIYFQEKNSKAEIRGLNRRTKFLSLENRKYKEELKKLESKLDSVHLLEKKIRKIFNIDEIDDKTIEKKTGGLGGPVINVLKNQTLESLLFQPEDRNSQEQKRLSLFSCSSVAH